VITRVFWFAVGTGAGVYGTVKARRLAYRLSPPGLSDQLAAGGLGLRALAGDVREAMTQREQELLERLGLEPRRPLEGVDPPGRLSGSASLGTGARQPRRRDLT